MARGTTTQSLIEKYWRPDIALFAGAICVGVFILYVNALTLSEMRDDTMRSVESSLKRQGLLLARESDLSFQTLDAALWSIAGNIPHAGSTGGGTPEARLGGWALHELLRGKMAGMPHVHAIALIGEDGRLINSSRQWPVPDADVSGSDYFRALKTKPQLEIFVGASVPNPIDAEIVCEPA